MPSLITPISSAQITLTSDEIRLLSAYRNMDDRGRGESLVIVEGTAEAHPRIPKRVLRLVEGRAK